MRTKGLLYVLMFVIALGATGCAALHKLEPPAVEYVDADTLFEQAFADWIDRQIDEELVEGDLTPAGAEAKRVALEAWRAMVAKARAEVRDAGR